MVMATALAEERMGLDNLPDSAIFIIEATYSTAAEDTDGRKNIVCLKNATAATTKIIRAIVLHRTPFNICLFRVGFAISEACGSAALL